MMPFDEHGYNTHVDVYVDGMDGYVKNVLCFLGILTKILLNRYPISYVYDGIKIHERYRQRAGRRNNVNYTFPSNSVCYTYKYVYVGDAVPVTGYIRQIDNSRHYTRLLAPKQFRINITVTVVVIQVFPWMCVYVVYTTAPKIYLRPT